MSGILERGRRTSFHDSMTKRQVTPLSDKRTRNLSILVLLLLAGSAWFLYASGFFAACSSAEALEAYIRGSAPYSHLFFFLLQLLSVVLAPIPSNITAAAGGMLFGTWPAFFLTFGAVLLGSCLVFLLARRLGQSFVDQMVSRKLSEQYQNVLHTKTTTFLVLAFLFPYFPDDVLCILAGLSKLSFRRFVCIALVTRPWGLLFASALGDASFSLPLWCLILIGILGVALFLFGMRYGDRIEQAILFRIQSKNL